MALLQSIGKTPQRNLFSFLFFSFTTNCHCFYECECACGNQYCVERMFMVLGQFDETSMMNN